MLLNVANKCHFQAFTSQKILPSIDHSRSGEVDCLSKIAAFFSLSVFFVPCQQLFCANRNQKPIAWLHSFAISIIRPKKEKKKKTGIVIKTFFDSPINYRKTEHDKVGPLVRVYKVNLLTAKLHFWWTVAIDLISAST